MPQLTETEFERLLGRLPAESPMSYAQADPALLLGDSLRLHARETRRRWHVGANDPVDYRRQDGRPARLFPDLYVLTDFAPPTGPWHLRTWVTGRAPDLVVEVLVPGSAHRDLVEKRGLYLEELGVQEYFVFDVQAARVPGQLVGWRQRETGGWEEIPTSAIHGVVRFPSQVLGLELSVADAPDGCVVPWVVRAYLPGAGDPLPSHTEARALRAEERLAALEAELRRLRGE